MPSPQNLLRTCVLSLGLLTVALRADVSPIVPGAKPVKLASDFEFTEGPAADKAGNIFFTDQPNNRIVEYSVDGKLSDWLNPSGRSNGTYFDSSGNLITCADENNELWSISPEKKITVLVKNFHGKLLNGPNDVWIAPSGNIYFTDPLYPRSYWHREKKREQPGEYVYLLDPRTGKTRPVETTLKKPNGIIGTPDGHLLYVADIGAGRTYSYSINQDGTLSARKLFCKMGSDGMTIDRDGNVYLTGKGVTIFNVKGENIDHIDIDEPWTANITFGGKDRKLLFITASKAVYTLEMQVSGSD